MATTSTYSSHVALRGTTVTPPETPQGDEMANPYTAPIPPTPRPPGTRPLHKRVVVWIGGSALLVAGALIGSTGTTAKARRGQGQARDDDHRDCHSHARTRPDRHRDRQSQGEARPRRHRHQDRYRQGRRHGQQQQQQQQSGQHRHVHDRLQRGELLLGRTVLPEQRPRSRHHQRERHEDQVHLQLKRMALDLHLTKHATTP